MSRTDEMDIFEDLWIGKHQDMINKLEKGSVLDLGCGIGQYTDFWMRNGFEVTSADLSYKALGALKERTPSANTVQLDMSKPLPFEDGVFDVVFANLSIHYFDEKTTHALSDEIYRVLKPNGLFIGSVNSTAALQYVKDIAQVLADNYYFIEEQYIRLFDRPQFDQFFSRFETVSLEHCQVVRFKRPKNQWEFILRKGCRCGFGVDLGGTTVKIACFDENGNMQSKWEIPTVTENGGSQILPDIAASILAYLNGNKIDRAQVIGIGIGVPGAVNGKGEVNKCINLGWDFIFNIEQELSERTGLPVKAGNDANVAALGEAWKGGGNGCENMVFATFGTGVGGGIIVGGKLLAGVHGAGGEIGHLVVNTRETARCACGKFGCAEQYCSATGIVRLAKMRLAADNAPSVLRGVENLTCKDVFDAGKAGDALAMEILEQVYDYMGQFLANVCCAVDPQVVVLGGGVSKAGQMLVDGAKKYFDRYIFHASSSITFALATLGNDAGAYGAFKLVLDGV